MNRHREQSYSGNSGTMTHTYPCGSHEAPVTTVLSSTHDVFDDVVTQDFSRRISSGDVVMNPCSKVSTIVDKTSGGTYHAVEISSGCVSEVIGSGSLTTAGMTWFGSPSYLTGSAPDHTDQAKLNAIASIDSTPYSFAEDLLEFRETIGILGSTTLHNLLDLVTVYNRRQRILYLSKFFRDASSKEKAKLLSDLYLEFRFGFLPLVRTASDLIDSLLSKDVEKPANRFAHGKGDPGSFSNSDVTSNTVYRFNRFIESHSESTATIAYRVNNPMSDWRSKYGVRNKDLLVGLWEVFPLSFMIDRLVNIKGALKGFINLNDPNLVVISGCSSVKIETRSSISILDQPNRPGWIITIVPDIDSVITRSYVRSLWQPGVIDVVPGFTPQRLINDTTKIIDLVSLIIQRLT